MRLCDVGFGSAWLRFARKKCWKLTASQRSAWNCQIRPSINIQLTLTWHLVDLQLTLTSAPVDFHLKFSWPALDFQMTFRKHSIYVQFTCSLSVDFCLTRVDVSLLHLLTFRRTSYDVHFHLVHLRLACSSLSLDFQLTFYLSFNWPTLDSWPSMHLQFIVSWPCVFLNVHLSFIQLSVHLQLIFTSRRSVDFQLSFRRPLVDFKCTFISSVDLQFIFC